MAPQIGAAKQERAKRQSLIARSIHIREATRRVKHRWAERNPPCCGFEDHAATRACVLCKTLLPQARWRKPIVVRHA
jgi:hypothetical protein